MFNFLFFWIKKGFSTIFLGGKILLSQSPPRGVIPRVEPQRKHKQFFKDNQFVDTVMIKINHAQRLLNRGETADSYLGCDTDVILTSTIHDKKLANFDLEKQINIVKRFQPDYVIPCDRPVYKIFPEDYRKWVIKDCYLKDIVSMNSILSETNTEIIPLIKGETSEERNFCYRIFEDLGFDYLSFYGVQYFSYGFKWSELIEDLFKISSNCKKDLLLIGLQSANKINRLPPQVRAVAGQRWITESNLNKNQNIEKNKKEYKNWIKKVNNALKGGQTTIEKFYNSDSYQTSLNQFIKSKTEVFNIGRT